MRTGWLVMTLVVAVIVAVILLIVFLPNKRPAPTGPENHRQHGPGLRGLDPAHVLIVRPTNAV